MRQNAAITTSYTAARITFDSELDFTTTRAGFDKQVPLLDPSVALDLVLTNATWAQVEAVIGKLIGSSDFVTLSRLDQGALLTLHGDPVEATQYLVGNPLISQRVISLNAAGALYAPFPLAIYSDSEGVHIAYTQPSSVFGSLGSADIDDIAKELDMKILSTVENLCHAR